MKKIFSLLLLAAFATSCINLDVDEKAAKAIENANQSKKIKPTGVLIHITHGSDDAHRALMGLTMASKMAEDKDVALYLDIKGIELVLKDADPVSFEDHFPPSDEMIRKLLKQGVAIMACPGCMAVMDVTDEMLIEGVMIAEKEKFFEFTKGCILTLDY